MENEELDLTLKLGLTNPTVDTRLSLATPANTDQGTNVVGGGGYNNDDDIRQRHSGNDLGASQNVDVNIRVYRFVVQQYAAIQETLNLAPYPMRPSSSHAPAPVTSFVSHLNSSLTIANPWNANANAAGSSSSGGRIKEARKCMNKNCNALNTPLWRRGPLGPKSLCNACGIKFRKEEERRAKATLNQK